MSVKTMIVCDRCGSYTIASKTQRPHAVRARLKTAGWVRAKNNGVVAYEGPLDYCAKCYQNMTNSAAKKEERT